MNEERFTTILLSIVGLTVGFVIARIIILSFVVPQKLNMIIELLEGM